MKKMRSLSTAELSLFVALPLLSACANMNPQPKVVPESLAGSDGFLSVSVAPGRSGSCGGTPCRIFYKTPDTGGQVKVVANGFVVGTFPGGTMVDLGHYSETNVRIEAPGSGAPITYVNMPNDSR